MKAFASTVHSGGLVLVPETAGESEALTLFTRMKIESLNASHDLDCGAIHFTLRKNRSDKESKALDLAEAFYAATRSLGMRPWHELMPSERTGIALNVEKLLAHLEMRIMKR